MTFSPTVLPIVMPKNVNKIIISWQEAGSTRDELSWMGTQAFPQQESRRLRAVAKTKQIKTNEIILKLNAQEKLFTLLYCISWR